MGNFKVEFLQPALDDLEEIVLYIAQGSVNDALKTNERIIAQAKKLETFPKLGRKVPDKKMSESGFRMLIISQYITFYRVIGNKIYIYRVLHATRNYPVLCKARANNK